MDAPKLKSDLIQRFLYHATHTPSKLAVLSSSQHLSYQQLLEEVLIWKSAFSTGLQGPVVVCLDRTPRILVVLLALQWLNIPYIPVDSTIPLERLRYIIEDSQAKTLLYDNERGFEGLPCVCLDLRSPISMPQIPPPLRPAHLAYIIYTSGSTGKPKGVAVSHKALNHFLSSMAGYFLNDADDLLLAITTLAFDIAALELYLPIWQGKTLFLSNQQEHQDPQILTELMERHPITLLQATPSMWSMLKHLNWKGQPKLTALCGGERLSESLATYLLNHVKALWNMYGPTEATVWCAMKQVTPDAPITIGRPLKGMHLFVMDPRMRPLPAYVKGELYIAGPTLAEGYVHNPKLTETRFIRRSPGSKMRLFRTGDIACRTTDGDFIIFGRTDHQVKLHGHRIELEEIEAQIQLLPEIHECAVTLHEEQLIAYLCLRGNQSFSKSTLHHALTDFLPDYMIPQDYIVLKSLPHNANGKIDRHRLPNPTHEHLLESALEFTPTQMALMQIWMELLNQSLIQPQDNFFDLGGHSLLAAQLVSQVAQRLKKKLSIQAIYRAPTLIQLAEAVEQADADLSTPPTFIQKRSWLPLNDFQLLFWFSTEFEPGIKTLNISARRRFEGHLSRHALNLALQLVYAKHEAFAFKTLRWLPIQKKQGRRQPHWVMTSLEQHDDEQTESMLNASFDTLYQHKTWSKRKPKLLAYCFYLRNQQIELQISMPHFIADESAATLFFHELSEAYLYYTQAIPQPPVISSQAYSHFALRQHHQLKVMKSTDIQFWKQYLKDVGLFCPPRAYIIPTQHTQTFTYSSYFPISANCLPSLQQLCEKHYFTIAEILCAAIALSIKQLSEQQVLLLINIVRSARTDPETAKAIGCFLENQCIKLHLDSTHRSLPVTNPAFNDLLALAQQVQQSALESQPYQSVASFIKFASIGKLPHKQSNLKTKLRALSLNALAHLARWTPFHPELFKACQRLSEVKRDHHFLISLNILNSFLEQVQQSQQTALFNLPNRPIPLYPYDQSKLNHHIEFCFLRANDNQPYLVITSNLAPEYRKLMGMTLLNILEKA